MIAALGFAAGMLSPVAGLITLTVASPLILLLFARWRRRGARARVDA